MAHLAKVVAILEIFNPIDVHTLMSVIELCNYYKIYVQNFNSIAHLLYALLKNDVVWTWNEEVQEAFHIQGKAFKVPHFEKTRFQQGFHSTH